MKRSCPFLLFFSLLFMVVLLLPAQAEAAAPYEFNASVCMPVKPLVTPFEADLGLVPLAVNRYCFTGVCGSSGWVKWYCPSTAPNFNHCNCMCYARQCTDMTRQGCCNVWKTCR